MADQLCRVCKQPAESWRHVNEDCHVFDPAPPEAKRCSPANGPCLYAESDCIISVYPDCPEHGAKREPEPEAGQVSEYESTIHGLRAKLAAAKTRYTWSEELSWKRYESIKQLRRVEMPALVERAARAQREACAVAMGDGDNLVRWIAKCIRETPLVTDSPDSLPAMAGDAVAPRVGSNAGLVGRDLAPPPSEEPKAEAIDDGLRGAIESGEVTSKDPLHLRDRIRDLNTAADEEHELTLSDYSCGILVRYVFDIEAAIRGRNAELVQAMTSIENQRETVRRADECAAESERLLASAEARVRELDKRDAEKQTVIFEQAEELAALRGREEPEKAWLRSYIRHFDLFVDPEMFQPYQPPAPAQPAPYDPKKIWTPCPDCGGTFDHERWPCPGKTNIGVVDAPAQPSRCTCGEWPGYGHCPEHGAKGAK